MNAGHDNQVLTPTLISELCGKDVMKVEFGQQFMVALTESLNIYSCGYDYTGMLGTGINSGTYRKPQKIDLSNKLVVDIKCCSNSTYLLTDTNQIYYFGYRPSIGSGILTPTLLNSINQKITSIVCGSDHTLALTDTGKVYAWGLNNYGQLGLGHTNNTIAPQLIQLPDNVFIKQIGCGTFHSLLLSTDGDIYSFGWNDSGQLGTGDSVKQMLPKLIDSKSKFTEIYAFGELSMALNNGNNITVWGKATVTSPYNTNMDSFQEAINTLTQKPFSYKPLYLKDLFIDKGVNRVMNTMSKGFNNPKNYDLKFKLKRKKVEEFEYIYGHKWIIETNSEYFERMFANNWSENKSNEIEINGYSYEAFYQFIRCLYTDCIETKDIEVLMEMLAITDEYLDEGIKAKTVKTIKPLMNIHNVCSLYSSALRNRSKELEEFCFKFMSGHINHITESKDFEEMDSNYAKHFLNKYSKVSNLKQNQ